MYTINIIKKNYSYNLQTLRGRGPRVGFATDPNPTQIFRVGENQNRNRPVLMVGSSSSGPLGFGLVSIQFQVSPPVPIFRRQCRYFAESVKYGVDLDKISPDLVDFKQIFVGKSKISPDLVDCSGFQVALCRKTFRSRRILLILWSGLVAWVFREETCQPTQRDRVLQVVTYRRPSDWSIQVVAIWFRAGSMG